jgi:hypothetical protein
MAGRFYRLTEQQSAKWITRYPQLTKYYDHKEYDWEDDVEGDEIYLIPETEDLILHIALSEYYTEDYQEHMPRRSHCVDVWHCKTCKQYAMPKHQRAGDHCVDCVIKTFKRV